MKTKNNTPSSEHEAKDRCPSCGNYCNINTDLDENDECNDCRSEEIEYCNKHKWNDCECIIECRRGLRIK